MNVKMYCAAIAVCLGVAMGFRAASVELVRDGKAVAEIVLAGNANPSQKLAAEDLQNFFKEISDAELKIVRASTGEFPNLIFAGVSEFTEKLGFAPKKFDSSGFEILAEKNYVILSGTDRHSLPNPFLRNLKKWREYVGEDFDMNSLFAFTGYRVEPLGLFQNDDTGTLYASSCLLEQLGVRFYWPHGEDGTVVPKMKNIAIPVQHTVKTTPFPFRSWTIGREPEGLRWLKRLGSGSFEELGISHSTYAIFAPREQHEKHPEYYAYEAAGKPWQGAPRPEYGMPRFSNPEFRTASILLVRKMFDAFPNLKAFSLGQPDGGIRMDYRDLEHYPGDDINQKVSNYFWDYTKAVAVEVQKSHPDRKLIYQAYGRGPSVIPKPLGEIPDNIIFMPFYLYTPNSVDPLEAEKFQSRIAPWLKICNEKNTGPFYDYFLYYRRTTQPRYPVFFTRLLQEQSRFLRERGSLGKFIEVPSDSTSRGLTGKKRDYPEAWHLAEYPVMSLMLYFQSKLYWNPDLDRDALMDEYCRLFFGPAASEMREFHDFAEEVWCRPESRSVTSTTGFLKDTDVERYFEILSLARSRAEPGSIYERRIAAMEKCYEPLKTFFPNITRKGPFILAYRAPDGFQIGGDFSQYKLAVWLRDKKTGKSSIRKAASTGVRVMFSPDRRTMYLIVRCNEDKMDKLRAGTDKNQDYNIFRDDVLEFFINTPERNYFKIAVNSNGAVWTESTDSTIIARDTLPELWRPDIKSVVRKHDDHWTVELAVPLADFGQMTPTKEYPWGIQIARTRYADGNPEFQALGTGEGGYNVITQWGNLWTKPWK